MSSRTALVTVTVEYEYVAEIEIDEDEYLEWSEGNEDTPELIREFLQAGDELDTIASVSAAATGEVTVSGIEDARWKP